MNKKDDNIYKRNIKTISTNFTNNFQFHKKENLNFKKTSYSEMYKYKLKYVYTDINLSSASEGSYSNLYKNLGLKFCNNEKLNSIISNRIKFNDKLNSRNCFSPKKNSAFKKSKSQISKSTYNSPRREISNSNNKNKIKIDLCKNESKKYHLSQEKLLILDLNTLSPIKSNRNKKKRNSNKENNKENNKEINKEYNKENNKEINKDINKDISKEINKEINNEINKDINNEINNEIDKNEIIKLQIKYNDDKIRNLLNKAEISSLNFDKQVEELYKDLFEVNEIKEVDEEEEGSLMGSKNPSKQIFNVNNNTYSDNFLLPKKKSEEKLISINNLHIIENEKVNKNKKKNIKNKNLSKNQSKENSRDNSLLETKNKNLTKNNKNNSYNKRIKNLGNLYKVNLKSKSIQNNIIIENNKNENIKYLNNSNLIKNSNESIDTLESSHKNKYYETPEKEIFYKNDFKYYKSNNNSFHSSFDNESIKENNNSIYRNKHRSLDQKCFNLLVKYEKEKMIFYHNKNDKKRKNSKIEKKYNYGNKNNFENNLRKYNNYIRPKSVNKVLSRNFTFLNEQINISKRNTNSLKKKKKKYKNCSSIKLKSNENIIKNLND